MELNNPKIIKGWTMYDWANSAYSLIITTTFFPIYYSSVAKQPDGTDIVNVFGWHISSEPLYSWMLTVAFLIAVILSPILTGIADKLGLRKTFMAIFCYLGAAACLGMLAFTAETFQWGVVLFILATVGFTGSIVFYNSFLPRIATPDRFDEVSAKGFAQGYIGSLILQIALLVVVLKADMFGMTTGTATRISFAAVGLWWGLWALWPLQTLPKDGATQSKEGWLLAGYHEIAKVFAEAKQNKPLFRYLTAFLFYNMGVQTIMYLATLYGDKELHLASEKLIVTVILLQLVAILGARLFAFISSKLGNIRTLQLIVMVWLVVCGCAYMVTGEYGFYGVASLVGLVMGGVQSMSRSTYAKLMPVTEDTASYFSLYDVIEKLSTVGGTFVFGFVVDATGSMRNSIIALTLFFIVGYWLLERVKDKGLATPNI